MKLRKTNAKNRTTYTYTFHNGGKLILYPKSMYEEVMINLSLNPDDFNEDIEITISDDPNATVHCGFVPAEEIAELHRADDRDVYNNVKNSRVPIEDDLKDQIAEWEAAHPGQKYTGNWHLHLDFTPDDDSDDDNSDDKSAIQKEASDILQPEEENPVLDRLHEIIDSFPANWQEIYTLAIVGEIPMTKIAQMRGVSEGAVRKIVSKIKAKIAADDQLKKFF